MHENMTEHIKKKLKEELAILEHEVSYDMPKELKKAVAMGDLSENAEYHMAKQRQEYLKARIRQLGKRLADLSLINMNNIPRDKVGLGSTVRVYDNTKEEEVEYTLVTSEETDVAAGKISTTSPIGLLASDPAKSRSADAAPCISRAVRAESFSANALPATSAASA